MTRNAKLDDIIFDYFLSSSSESTFFPKPFPFINPISPFHPPTDLDLPLDLLNPTFPPLDLLSPFDTVTDLIHIQRTTPSGTTTTARRLTARRRRSTAAELYLQSLSDRVSALELDFDLINDEKEKKKKKKEKVKKVDRKYAWTAEIISSEKDGSDRKYKLVTEIKGGKKKEKSCKWTAEIQRKGEDARKYSFTASTANAAIEDDSGSEKEKKNKKKDKKKEKTARIVEIQGSPDHGAIVLKQVYFH